MKKKIEKAQLLNEEECLRKARIQKEEGRFTEE